MQAVTIGVMCMKLNPVNAKGGESALIHLNVSKELKGRWIQASRADGKRLADWIIEIVERYMEQRLVNISIPDDLNFKDLKLGIESDGSYSFDMQVIERICKESNLPLSMITDAPEDNVASLILRWYELHLQNGGEPDPVMAHSFNEVLAEEKAGQSFSYPAGKA